MTSRKTLVVGGLIYGLWFMFLFGASDQFPSLSAWIKSTEHWDVLHFEKIWRGGYLNNHVNLGAAPGFAYLTGSLSDLLNIHFTYVGTIISALGFLVGALMAAFILARRFQVPPVMVFLWALSMPASFFAFIPYSDGIFFGLFWILLWSLDKSLSRRISLLFILPFFRIVAFALLSWILLFQYYVLILLIPLALWLLVNQKIGGSYFYFQEVQKIFGMPEGNIVTGFGRACDSFFHFQDWIPWLSFQAIPLGLLVLFVLTSVWFWRRGERVMAVTIVSIVFMSHNQGFWRSVVRYDWPIYPFLCVPMLATKGRWRLLMYALFVFMVVGGLMLQIIYSNLFHRGEWAF